VPKGDVETSTKGAWHNKVEGTGEVLGSSYPTEAEAQTAAATTPRPRSNTSSAASTAGSGNATPTATTQATSPAEGFGRR
jgi:hypothetical protein